MKEGYDGSNSWAVNLPPVSISDEEQDALDAEGLYSLLEKEVVPLYYDRDVDGISHGWCTVVKQAIRTVAPQFSARRMLKEYVSRAYAPLLDVQALETTKQKLA
ncbi:MAG: hypothetical protein KC643_24870 [Nitrospira sp.]|nr:hypothetical protein [Nitrospira sp.]